ncbi:MAG: Brp/Blh family beta-carotene 15,15'-dioxygenase [Planctomycetota bacterium]
MTTLTSSAATADPSNLSTRSAVARTESSTPPLRPRVETAARPRWLETRVVLLASWVAVGSTALVAGSLGVDRLLGPWLWVAAGLVVGLAHGACDAFDAPAKPARRLAWWVAYGGVIALMLGLALLIPEAALAGFLLLTAWHFGAADQHDLSDVETGKIMPIRRRWVAGFGRMGLFFGAMGVTQAGAVAEVGNEVGRFFTWRITPAFQEPDVMLFCGGLLVMGALAWTISELTRWFGKGSTRRTIVIDALETIGLVGLAVWLDPLFAVGLYFLAWHAPRRIARQWSDTPSLLGDARQRESVGRSVGLGLWRYHLRSAWLWLPIWPAWALWVCVAGEPERATAWAAGLIALCVVLTPIHHFLGERREARRIQ